MRQQYSRALTTAALVILIASLAACTTIPQDRTAENASLRFNVQVTANANSSRFGTVVVDIAPADQLTQTRRVTIHPEEQYAEISGLTPGAYRIERAAYYFADTNGAILLNAPREVITVSDSDVTVAPVRIVFGGSATWPHVALEAEASGSVASSGTVTPQ